MRSGPCQARRWSRAGAIAVAWVLAAPRARADCAPRDGLSPCIDADLLWPHPGGGSFLSLGATTTTPAQRVSAGVVLSYLSRPVGLRVGSPDPDGTVVHVVDDMVDATLLASLGITDRLELGVAAPMALYQNGAGLGDLRGTGAELPRSAVRDPRFGLAWSVLPRPRTGEARDLAVTARLEFAVPAGDDDAFATNRTMVAIPTVVATWVRGRLELGAEAGARVRDTTSFAGVKMASQASLALGGAYEVWRRAHLFAGAEVFGLYTFADQPAPIRDRPDSKVGPALAPAEWLASVRTGALFSGDAELTLAGGSFLPLATEPALGAPRFRFDLAFRYAPTGHDTDGDGVLDRDDRCPTQPEDRDGFEDADGCPDPDNDGDRIPDARDRCRDVAEDFDGTRDDDGCPDADDDGDGVPDAEDKCRSQPEDRDGFQDDDGCPDPDNDGDGIPDAQDRCPMGKEDKDGFKDDDGCPDPDDDLDGIPDADDRCPREPEDKDGFEDTDGCPDPDDDHDGVVDAADRCPRDAETIDGKDDDDGCPEAGARSRVAWDGARVVLAGVAAARFRPGSAEPTPELRTELRMIAQLVRGRTPLQNVLLEAYADRVEDASAKAQDLAARRAAAAADVLAAAGIPRASITAAAGDPGARRPPNSPSVDVTITPLEDHARR